MKKLTAKTINKEFIIIEDGEFYKPFDKENQHKIITKLQLEHCKSNDLLEFNVRLKEFGINCSDCVEIRIGGKTETKSGSWDDYYAFFKEPVKEESQDELVQTIINTVLYYSLSSVEYKAHSDIRRQFTINRNK